MAKIRIFNVMLSILATLMLSYSCSKEDCQKDAPVVPPNAMSGIEAVTDAFTFGKLDDSGVSTRSAFLWNEASAQYIFQWESTDHLAVYSTEKVRADYTLKTGANAASATFDGGGFELKTGNTYYGFSYFRVAKDEAIGNTGTDINHIYMSYSGQVQKGNHDSRHLGAFDYQAAAAVAGQGNHAVMHYKHLGSVVRFFLTLPTDETAESVTFTKLTLTDYNITDPNKKLFNQPLQVLDFEKSKGTNIDDYQPYLESAEIIGEQPEPFSISLRNNEGADDSGIIINKTDNKTLVVHVFIPALELKGQVMKAVLETTEDTKKYYFTFNATNFLGGKYYNVTRTLIPSGTIDIRLKVNPDWQLGNTQAQTRAQGDPGYDKDVHAPKYVYPYIVLDGVTDGQASFYAFDAITTTEADWTLDKDGVYVYNKPLSYSYTGAPTAGRVYAIASDYELTLSASNESDLKGLSYSIPNENSQKYMRNLYSTPLVTSANVPFTGTVIGFEDGTPSANVTLYHVAAKVDVQWNATAALSTTNSFVSVNDVKNSGLYYFKPTENSPGTGTYDVSEPITPGTMYNGRQVFYLPQFATPTYNTTYNIKVGGEVPATPVEADNVTFTPSITNGWTSWLKANINK